MSRWKLLTPFTKQCIVTAGVSMNVAGGAIVMAYTAAMLPQLRKPDSDIPIDESSGSWIAATPGISWVLGNLFVPSMMSYFGRRTCNLLSIITVIIGWLCMYFAKNFTVVIIIRFIHGISLGTSILLGPILIGEYTSPKNRGVFLMTTSLSCGGYVLLTHTLGSLFTWRTNALVAMCLGIVNLPIAFFSPESPSWLADKGKYEDSKKAFRWLRGDDEEEELKSLIKASMVANKAKEENEVDQSYIVTVKTTLIEFKHTLTKKAFYKPIFIMVHVYTLGQWAGINVLSTYVFDIIEKVVGIDSNIALHIAVLDAQRFVSTTTAMFIIKKLKRRTMLLSGTGINIVAILSIAAYVYVRSRNMFESPILGLALLHLHMFAVASVTLPLPLTIAGELFPLKYKGMAGAISINAYALNCIICVKTMPGLFNSIGMYGAYILYAGLVSYCLLVVYIFLPETKDRTLQDIEKEFTGEDKSMTLDELKSVQSLMGV